MLHAAQETKVCIEGKEKKVQRYNILSLPVSVNISDVEYILSEIVNKINTGLT